MAPGCPRLGADLALFPELWQIGYTDCPVGPQARREWAGLAVEPDDPWLQAFRDLARQADIAIAITYLQRWRGAPRNAATVIDWHGAEIILTPNTCPLTDDRVGQFRARPRSVRQGLLRHRVPRGCPAQHRAR